MPTYNQQPRVDYLALATAIASGVFIAIAASGALLFFITRAYLKG